jgi:hypothetical protein
VFPGELSLFKGVMGYHVSLIGTLIGWIYLATEWRPWQEASVERLRTSDEKYVFALDSPGAYFF